MRGAVRRAVAGTRGVLVVSGDPGVGKTRILTELGRWCRQRGLASGGVLILDDVHLADESTAERIERSVRRRSSAPLLLAVGCRPRQLSPRLSAVLFDAAGEDHCEVLRPPGLSVDETAELLGLSARTLRLRRIHELSGGVPGYALALDRAWPPNVDLDREDALLAVPIRVGTGLQDELDALSAPARLAMRAAAVVGDQFAVGVVAKVAELDADATVRAVDELVDRDIVRPDAEGFTFRHPLVRAVVWQQAGLAWRWEAHSRAAAAVRAGGGPATSVARHMEHCAMPGDRQAVEVLVSAAVSTVHSAPATAAQWLGTALHLLPEDSEAEPWRAYLLTTRAHALAQIGRLQQSRDLLHEALTLMPHTGDSARLWPVVLSARVERSLGHLHEAHARLVAELTGVHLGQTASEALLTLEIAAGCLARGDLDGVRRWATKALALADDHHGEWILYTAVSAGLLILTTADGREQEASIRHVAAVVPVIDAATDGELMPRLDAVASVAQGEMRSERYRDAIRHYERGIRLARRGGRRLLLGDLLVGAAQAHNWSGQLDQALSCAEDALELSASPATHTAALAELCRVAIWRDKADNAVRLGQEAVRLAGPPDTFQARLSLCLLGVALLRAGQPAECVEHVLRATTGVPPCMLPWICGVLTQAELARGDVVAANHWARRASAAATEALPGGQGFGHLALGQVALAGGEAMAARASAAAAARAFAAAEMPLLVGSAHLLDGEACIELRDREAALSELGVAGRTAQARGAVALQDQVSNALRRLGSRMPRPRDAPGGLTTREEEIAQLIGAGLTNRQIGDRLRLSTRTIESHLTRIYGKVGVSGRAALAVAVCKERG
ncbi:LuxR C-terminal-related transcriptional regulator [Actinocrispum wychmicini]|uniref:Regulatory LuxR family protein n=1 Tax=Actinocrispum wychmicini TaxID=1213861 RepID=A0A4V2S3P9_9PSEU|nr:LuxR C-terminal-related transcriptional regulator [Actinocrispum wychmicini]TCO45260.1 regulatory LuxR family protein [Actinocrispum wychmicini]